MVQAEHGVVQATSASAAGVVTARAAAGARAVAGRVGVDVRQLETPEATREAAELLSAIWQVAAGGAPVNSDLMRAMGLTGNYVAGAYLAGRLVGVSVAFFTGDRPAELHSHISGVAADLQGRGVGFTLKLHQRAWALAHGVRQVTWTVDPLVRRNAFFNLAKLGADVVSYLPDFYGPMFDGVNARDESDRLLLTWRLTADRVTAACDGTALVLKPATLSPVGAAALLDVGSDGAPLIGAARGPLLCCRLPTDIVHIRCTDPDLARAWRRALRDTLGRALDAGHRVLGVTADGSYMLDGGPPG